jgi:hypothetical protein
MTKEQHEFECYCLDRLKPIADEFPVTYNDGVIIKKLHYKVGLRASIKHVDCFVLYTMSEDDLNGFLFIPVDTFYNNQKRFFHETLTKTEVKELIKVLPAINIFEFVSLLDFSIIYEEFKEYLEENWEILQMNDLIEV